MAMTMTLMLRKAVPNLGKEGEVVNVKNGYGRNYLLPQRLAVEMTKADMHRLEVEKKRKEEKEKSRISNLRKLAERMNAISITLIERMTEEKTLYGSVSARDVHEHLLNELPDAANDVPLEAVNLPEPIKDPGLKTVEIILHPQVKASVKVWVVGDTKKK
jgi:large subunit ribosomal protein L9